MARRSAAAGHAPPLPAPQTLGGGRDPHPRAPRNPTTGERIFDVLKVSARAHLRQPPSRRRSAGRARGQMALVRAAALVGPRALLVGRREAYREALEIQPRDPSVHNKLGICYQQLENRVMARRSYNGPSSSTRATPRCGTTSAPSSSRPSG